MKSRYRNTLHAGLRRAALFAIVASAAAYAQVPTSSLSGTVQDASGAEIPGATVSIKNTATGATQTSTSNGSGYFTFPALQFGDYDVTVTAVSFGKFTQTGLHLNPGDTVALNQIKLGVVNTDVVEVTADAARIDTTSGEISSLITASDIKHLAVQGRDVTELFKILPGFANANRGVSNSSYDPSQVSVNGAIGSYAANGAPLNGVSLKWDGANITDVGNYGASIQNVNYDMVSEVKVQTANFGADLSNGPVVVNAVTKAGGNRFHGDLYTYARTYQLNSTDALAKELGYNKPPDRYVYPGFNFGGPVTIPGTGFNRNGRVTFFAGVEDYAQRNNYAYGDAGQAIVRALVPTARMRTGDFSQAALTEYLGPNALIQTSPGVYANQNNSASYGNVNLAPQFSTDGSPLTNGKITHIDPGGQGLLGLLPLPNIASTGAYNYITQNLINNNMYQYVGRVDVAFSERYHFFARYSGEKGASGVPQVPYYSPNSSFGGVDTPGGGLLSTINSQSAAANLTMTLSSTLTNEVFGSIAYLNQGFDAKNRTAITKAANNYPYAGAYYQNGSTAIPQLQDYGNDGFPLLLTPDLTYGPIFAHKFTPNGGDNVTKLLGRHTLKVGTYVEHVTNNERQPFANTNGALNFYYFPAQFTDSSGTYTTSGNYLANGLEGLAQAYTQQNLLPAGNNFFWNVDFYANDNWQVNKRLTVNYGLRFEHLGTWNDAHGVGIAIFDPTTVNLPASAVLSNQPGLKWHATDPSVPVSGISSRPLFYEPRVGFSLDVTGKGKSVVRGGYGQYRYHDSWGDVANAVYPTDGVKSTYLGGAGISLLGVSQAKLTQNAGGISLSSYGLMPGDNQAALTTTYSLTFDQILPYKTQLEVAYIGNNSNYLMNDGSNQTVNLADVNALPIGALYNPNNPNNGGKTPTPLQVSQFNAGQINSFRKYPGAVAVNGTNANGVDYETSNGDFLVPQHNATANYNSVQLSLAHQAGNLRFGVNYTFSKALGLLGGPSAGNPIDPTNLASNYSILAFDRTHILNANYTYIFGSHVHNRLVGGFANGWEVSGITQLQSGQDLPVAQNIPNFGLTGNLGVQGSTSRLPVNSQTFLGTPDVTLLPRLTCNPSQNLAKGQYVNPNCFALPNIGTNGQTLPYLHGPSFFQSDITAQKAFGLGEARSLQLRVAAFNFLNHPLPTFQSNNASDGSGITNLTISNLTQPTVAGSSVTSPNFGSTHYEIGRRVMEVSLKLSF